MKYRVKLSLLVIPLLALLLSLGFWQLSRYEQKLELEQALEQRRSMQAIGFPEISRYQDPLYLPLKVSGRFVSDHYFFHDNQIFQGQAGYDLLMPFITDSGRWILVNRGWLPSPSRETWPEFPSVQGEVEVQGSLYRLLGKPFVLGDDAWQKDWPKRIQALDFERMAKALGQDIPPFILRLDEGQPGVETVRPLQFKTSSQKHLGYAFQWFTMALVLLGLYAYQMNKHKFDTRGKRSYAGRD